MSFTATSPVTIESETDIENDGWFPDIVLATARDEVRIDGTISAARLRSALIEAITSVNDELNTFKAAQIAAGYTSLGSVPSENVDGISRHTHRYRRAVFCLAKSNLIERYRDYDSTSEGNKRADELEPGIGELRRDARWAISDISGNKRTTIELI